jgi:hypothetical protein
MPSLLLYKNIEVVKGDDEMIDAHKIVYNNLSSEEFDVTLHLSFDNESGASNSFLNREAISTEVYDGSRKFIHGSKYTDSATPRFTLIKENFQDFTPEENRRVLAWLTGNSKPSWLEIYKDDSNVMDYRYFCIVSNVEQYKLSNGRVVGYEFEITSSTPFALSRPMTWPQNLDDLPEYEYKKINSANKTLGSTDIDFTIECETDEYSKVLYPKVTIKHNPNSIYFPVRGDTDPTANNAYDMIPNVIYSYTDNTGKETLRININREKHVVTPLTEEGAELSPDRYVSKGYCYSPTNKDIRKAVEGETSETYVWESVGKVYAAVQIENKYKLNGEDQFSKTWIAGGLNGETIVLDGENKIIYNKTQDDQDAVMIIGDRFNFDWLPLAYGTNNITITGNCEIKFEWVEPRKVGSL